MPKVKFLPSDTTVEVDAGTLMLDALWNNDVDVITSCTSGVCCSDPCRIIEGIENVSAQNDQEAETLELNGYSKDVRLACQCVINGDCVVEVNV